MDPNNRLHLNLGTSGYNNERNYQANNERVFPTTPSTFPQPIFPSQGGQVPHEYVASQMQSPGGYGAGQSYFQSNPYPAQYSQPHQAQYPAQYQQQQNLPAPQPPYQQRQGGYHTNDPTSGLAHQFSNQNLGSSQRQGSPFGRQPSPNQRPRTGGAPTQQNHGSLLTPPIPGSIDQTQADEHPPEKNPEKYSTNVGKRGQGLHVLVEAFFKENITRARDRNLR